MRVIPTRGGGRTRGEYRATPLAAPPPSSLSCVGPAEPQHPASPLRRNHTCVAAASVATVSVAAASVAAASVAATSVAAAASCRRRLSSPPPLVPAASVAAASAAAASPREFLAAASAAAAAAPAAATPPLPAWPPAGAPPPLRLRQMAVAERARGRGVGRLIVEASRDDVLCKNLVS